nr:unnamed protein product [Callosobruchus analis]
MRPAYGESQNAAVVADSDLAELIVKKGRLRLVHCKYKSVKGQNTGNAGILGPARKLAKDRIEVDEDIWGKGYRIVFATLRMGSPLPEISLEKKKKIVQVLFTDQGRVTYNHQSCSDVSLSTRDELILAAQKLKTGKSPGPDGIPTEIVKYAIMETQETCSFLSEPVEDSV